LCSHFYDDLFLACLQVVAAATAAAAMAAAVEDTAAAAVMTVAAAVDTAVVADTTTVVAVRSRVACFTEERCWSPQSDSRVYLFRYCLRFQVDTTVAAAVDTAAAAVTIVVAAVDTAEEDEAVVSPIEEGCARVSCGWLEENCRACCSV
jgi:hypothetical protein